MARVMTSAFPVKKAIFGIIIISAWIAVYKIFSKDPLTGQLASAKVLRDSTPESYLGGTLDTLFSVAKDVRVSKAGSTTLGDLIKPVPFDKTIGYRMATPESLGSLIIPASHYDGQKLEGFQRILRPAEARKIARALEQGKDMPPVLVSIDENGNPLLTDGQHRSVGSMLSGCPIAVVVEKRTYKRAQELFANQKLGVAPSNDYLILSGTGPYNEYIQDALTDDRHPWADIVGPGAVGGPGSSTKITPSSMFRLLIAYAGNQAGIRTNSSMGTETLRWEQDMADELATLVECFGTRVTNSDAFKPGSLSAIGVVTTLAIGRTGRKASDIARWKAHMPTFHFNQYAHLTPTVLIDTLIAHWNKRLRESSRIVRPRS